MIATQQPSREAFIAYWKDFGTFKWHQLLFYILYPGGLAVYAFIVSRINSADGSGCQLVGAADTSFWSVSHDPKSSQTICRVSLDAALR